MTCSGCQAVALWPGDLQQSADDDAITAQRSQFTQSQQPLFTVSLLFSHIFTKSRLHITESSALKKRLQLSEALLLAPKSDLITRKQNFCIKDALFEFIADTKVKL